MVQCRDLVRDRPATVLGAQPVGLHGACQTGVASGLKDVGDDRMDSGLGRQSALHGLFMTVVSAFAW